MLLRLSSPFLMRNSAAALELQQGLLQALFALPLADGVREQRQALGLNQNWEDLNRQYQGLPLFTDTIGKRQRRLCLEQTLLQLEKDIALMKGHQTIYIAHD
ncbi:hypothetical protein CRUP_035372 [Coryphaenoides rupestris]|nr:hypothetical protein CRUP_035372 [Coryphaenoides rupestris]